MSQLVDDAAVVYQHQDSIKASARSNNQQRASISEQSMNGIKEQYNTFKPDGNNLTQMMSGSKINVVVNTTEKCRSNYADEPFLSGQEYTKLTHNTIHQLSCKYAGYTQSLFGSRLLYAKDLPVYRINGNHTSHFESLNNLTMKAEQCMRFEIEIVSKNNTKGDKNTVNDVLYMSLYDENDPSQQLYLTQIDFETFKKVQQRQILAIESFSQLPEHIAALVDNCILKRPTNDETATMCCQVQLGEYTCTLKDHTKHSYQYGKFHGNLQDTTEAYKYQNEQLSETEGILFSIFQKSDFRNLLHLELFFRQADDADARKWLSRRSLLQKAISNDLVVEKEQIFGDMQKLTFDYGKLDEFVAQLRTQHEQQLLEMEVKFNEKLEELQQVWDEEKIKIDQKHIQLIEVKQAELDSAKLEITQINVQMQGLNKELDNNRQSHDASSSKHDATNQQLNMQISQLKEDLQAKINQIKQQDSELQVRADSINQLNANVQNIQGKFDILTEQYKNLDIKCSQYQKQIEELTRTNQSQDYKLVNLDDVNTKNALLEQEIENLKGKVEKQKRKKQEMSEKKKHYKEKLDLKEQINVDLQTKIEEQDDLGKQLNDEINDLKGQNTEMSDKNTELVEKLQECQKSLIENSKVIKELSAKLTQANTFSFKNLIKKKVSKASDDLQIQFQEVVPDQQFNHEQEQVSQLREEIEDQEEAFNSAADGLQGSMLPQDNFVSKTYQAQRLQTNQSSMASQNYRVTGQNNQARVAVLRSNVTSVQQPSCLQMQTQSQLAQLRVTDKYTKKFGLYNNSSVNQNVVASESFGTKLEQKELVQETNMNQQINEQRITHNVDMMASRNEEYGHQCQYASDAAHAHLHQHHNAHQHVYQNEEQNQQENSNKYEEHYCQYSQKTSQLFPPPSGY